MDNNINIDKTTGEVKELTAATKNDLEYALEQIERISTDTAHIGEAFAALRAAAEENEGTPCGGSCDKIAEAVAATVKAREETNRKLIEFYAKMADDLKPQKKVSREQMFLDWITAMQKATLPGVSKQPDYVDIWQAMNNVT